jgi:hypothetical protein
MFVKERQTHEDMRRPMGWCSPAWKCHVPPDHYGYGMIANANFFVTPSPGAGLIVKEQMPVVGYKSSPTICKARRHHNRSSRHRRTVLLLLYQCRENISFENKSLAKH